MTPSWYCWSTSNTWRRACSIRSFFDDGVFMSSMPIERPDSGRVPEPDVLEVVQELDGLGVAQVGGSSPRRAASTSFFLSSLFTGRSSIGTTSLNSTRPTVVSTSAAGFFGSKPAHPDPRLKVHVLRVVRHPDLFHVREASLLTPGALPLLGQVVDPEHHVLGGDHERRAVRRRQHVVGGQHEDLRLELRLVRERHVHRHLVPVEVRVERGADERVDLDGLALDQDRLERLDARAGGASARGSAAPGAP